MLTLICAGSIYHTPAGACLMERRRLVDDAPGTVRREVFAEGADGEWMQLWNDGNRHAAVIARCEKMRELLNSLPIQQQQIAYEALGETEYGAD